MDTLLLTNILLIMIIFFLFAIYKDINNRVVALLKRLDITINGLKKFMVLNQEQDECHRHLNECLWIEGGEGVLFLE